MISTRFVMLAVCGLAGLVSATTTRELPPFQQYTATLVFTDAEVKVSCTAWTIPKKGIVEMSAHSAFPNGQISSAVGSYLLNPADADYVVPPTAPAEKGAERLKQRPDIPEHALLAACRLGYAKRNPALAKLS